MNTWLLLVLSLPTENSTVRMRAWRALKAAGAAVLRDGVYLLPDRPACLDRLSAVAADVRSAQGTAFLLGVVDDHDVGDFPALFDRSAAYGGLVDDVSAAREALTADTAFETIRQLRKLRKAFAGLEEVDFFPGEARRQADAALGELETLVNQVLSPDEPRSVPGAVERLVPGEYRGRVWATRRRPWVDRLACAWLIRRHIDPQARFLWLPSPEDCPPDALGFDFDGARFTHVGARVTFEVLLASFGLETPALLRLGALVHYLDAGGVQPSEAVGVERVLAGMREGIADDDQLLQAAAGVFDGLLLAFDKESSSQ